MEAVADAGMMNWREVDRMIDDLLGLGWDYLKRVNNLLEKPQNRV